MSPREPELLHIAEQAGWPTQHLGESKPYDGFLERLAAGQEWAFQVTANPVHTVTDDVGRKRKLAHVTAAQQTEWFLSKSSAHGFEVAVTSSGDADLELRDRGTRTFKRNGSTVTLGVATFVGRLQITDVAVLRQTMRLGFGRAKGYGCGLLTLSPLPATDRAV